MGNYKNCAFWEEFFVVRPLHWQIGLIYFARRVHFQIFIRYLILKLVQTWVAAGI